MTDTAPSENIEGDESIVEEKLDPQSARFDPLSALNSPSVPGTVASFLAKHIVLSKLQRLPESFSFELDDVPL